MPNLPNTALTSLLAYITFMPTHHPLHICCLAFDRCTIPELNPEMDVYRIGTLLEMVREIAYVLAQDGKRVKVCVQQSMGQGVFQVCDHVVILSHTT